MVFPVALALSSRNLLSLANKSVCTCVLIAILSSHDQHRQSWVAGDSKAVFQDF